MPGRFEYAGLGRRIIALTLDFVALSLIFFPVTRLVKGVWFMSSGDHLWGWGWVVTDPLCLVFLIVIVLYFVAAEGLLGATFGKWLMRLRVVGPDGREPGLMRAAARNLLRAIDALPAFSILGMILIVMSPERARLGDRVAATRVIIRR